MCDETDEVGFLRSITALGPLDDAAASLLVGMIDWRDVAPGDRLFEEGDVGDSLFVVRSGRFRVLQQTDRGPLLLREIGRGDVLGEIALLTGEPRSATVVASRPSRVGRLSITAFERFLSAAPHAGLALARQALARTSLPPTRAPRLRGAVVVLLGVGPVSVGDVMAALRPVARVVDAAASSVEVALASERDDDGVVLVDLSAVAAPERRRWFSAADRLLLVAPAVHEPDRTAVTAALDELPPDVPSELLLWHGRSTRGAAVATARARAWVRDIDLPRHHHLRDGEASDADRLLRHLTGRSVALAVGGGGARSFAAIGVLRALREREVPVDRVCGTSMGSFIAGMVALGWTPERMVEHCRRSWRIPRFVRDLTVPSVSLLGGRTARRIYDETFHDTHAEQLWVPWSCTSVDLSACELAVHDRGPMSQWVMASSSVPGLWPPVVDQEGHLHVDGGLLDNVPVGVLRRDHRGPILAIDVYDAQAPMTVDPGARLRPGLANLRSATGARYPSLLDVFNRTSLMGGVRQQRVSRDLADLRITPPCERYGLASFDALDALVEVGYRTAVEQLDASPDVLATVRTGR